MNLENRLIRQAMQFKTAMGFTVLFTIAGGLCIILQAKILSTILNRAFLGQAGVSELKSLFFILLGVILLRAAVTFLSDLAAHRTAAGVKSEIRDQLLDRLSEKPSVLSSSENSGELSTVILQGVDTLESYFSQYLPQLIIAVIIPISILVFILPLDWLSGVVLLVTAPLIPIFMILIGKNAEETTQKQWVMMRRMSVHFLDTLQGLKVLRSLNRFESKLDQLRNTAEQYRSATMKVLQVTFLSSLVLELVGTLSTAVIAVQIGLRLLFGRLDFEAAFFILVLAPEFYFPLRQLGLRFHAGMSAVTAAQRIYEFLHNRHRSDNLPENSSTLLKTITNFEDLNFETVSFNYPDRQKDAVTHLSFQVRQGEQVALIGPSGSGKSTVIALLLGFIEPVEGSIFINGIPLTYEHHEHWRAQVSWLPQTPHLFNGTLNDNITLVKPDAKGSEIKEAISLAGLTRLIQQLPQGINTKVGTNGTRLSGGEAQRVALARAFLKDSEVLIMDEPTANLDLELEQDLVNAIDTLRKNKTVIMIAHRLSSIQKCDRILFLENGRLVEQGSPADLMTLDGRYAAMFAAYRGLS